MQPLSEASVYIDLDRRFERVAQAESSEVSALRSYTAENLFGDRTGLTWDDLLKNHLVVVLGETGSGKTWEFRERAKILRSAGHFAFYVRLDQLINNSFEEALGPDDYRLFKSWRRGEKIATFLLDSVDEAKFRRLSEFYDAVGRFAHALRPTGLMGARILLSSRISEWKPSSDAHELLLRLRVEPEEYKRSTRIGSGGFVAIAVTSTRIAAYQNMAKEWEADPSKRLLTVHLQPLDRTRVERFAQARRVLRASEFLKALDDNHAWEFARRPLDVVGLFDFWQEKNRLGSLSEMVEFDLRLKLQAAERDRNDPISFEEARYGAETLGVATAFCRRFTFKVPDDAFGDTDALDASACLPPRWRKEQVGALLTRAIFDGASYGQVRFHHRRAAEYLAAEWLNERMDRGCPGPELEHLLFDFVAGERVIRPALAPVTAWLCRTGEPWGRDLRGWVLEADPSIHLQFGDPASLPIEYRRKLLYTLVKQSGGRARSWIQTSPDSLSRLADPALANDISTIISNHSVSQDLRSEMIQMVRYGNLTACLPTLLSVIEDSAEEDKLKSYAAAAVRDIGDHISRRRLAELAIASTSLDNHFCGLVCEAAYPPAMTAIELVSLLRKVGSVGRHVGDIHHHLKHHFERALDGDNAGDLLGELIPLSMTPPHIPIQSKGVRVSEQFSWLGELLSIVVLILMRKIELSETETCLTTQALLVLGEFRHHAGLHDEKLEQLNPATVIHPEVRQAYFWALVREYRIENEKEPTFIFQIFDYSEVLRPLPEDFEWLLKDAQHQLTLPDRELAMRFAFALALDNSTWRLQRRRIEKAIGKNDKLRPTLKQLIAQHRFLRVRRFWYQRVRHTIGERWWWKRRFRLVKNYLRWVRSQWIFLTHLRKLTSGDAVGWLSYLTSEANKSGNHRWAPDDWNELRRKRGRLVAWASKAGCKRAWRKFSPPLPHEEPNPTQTDARIIVGLSGLQAAAIDGELNGPKLSDDEARQATRYGVNELNGFAPWLAELSQHRPTAVSSVLSECVSGEWAFPPGREHVHEVISKLVWQGESLLPLVEDRIWELVQQGDPPHARIHEFAVSLLIRSREIPKAKIAALAEKRTRSNFLNSVAFSLWMRVLLQLDARRGLDAFDAVVDKLPHVDDIVVGICAALDDRHSDNTTLIPHPSYREPSNLSRFIRLVYRHVRPSDDIHRQGGYTPTARDEAQMFRGNLLDVLAKSDLPNASDALRELMDEPLLAGWREWIAHLLDERRKRKADLAPWNPSDINVFENEHEVDPKTDRELFGIACKRLLELKLDVERAENSLRRELHPDYDEAELRKWLHRKLRERSRKRYTVPEEVEIDLEQRPDLRMENPKTDPVSIEVKWAEKWSVAQMLERLETQLIGQYLRAHNSRYGIYVLGVIDPTRKHWENPSDGSRIQFEELVNLIRDRARNLSVSRSDVDEVEVFGIDFRDPRR